jgi:type VII secretion protein EccB
MASRRDELNAYTFARKRMVGAFLQPSGGGNDEDAPRPLRAVLPSVVVAAVTVAGFGLWGVIKPSAPQGWDSGKYILQGKDSTTRYVVVTDDQGRKQLHQVLNMASAKLVLAAGATVLTVADDVLDKYPHGSTIGIPYAPDKLPKPADAGVTKKWSVCDKPGVADTFDSISQSVFVAADDEAKKLEQPGKLLADGQSLFVQAPPEPNQPNQSEYLVDPNGFKHAIGEVYTDSRTRSALESALFTVEGANNKEKVTLDWLKTLQEGEKINFPAIPDGFSADHTTPSNLKLSNVQDRKVGRLLHFQDNTYYVVGKDKLYQVTPFWAELTRNNPQLQALYDNKQPVFDDLTSADYAALSAQIDTSLLKANPTWPTAKPAVPVNGTAKNARTVICSTFERIENNKIVQSVWADAGNLVDVNPGSVTAHVTPGHGLVFRAVDSAGQDTSGANFLITETGLRYSLPANSDGKGGSASPAPQPQGGSSSQSGNQSQERLGYKDVVPVPVPTPWALLVPAGPALNTNAALQAQTA